MSIWSRIAKLLTGGGATDNRMLTIYVMSHRCREPIAGQVDLLSELSRTEDEDGFFTRKVLHTSGENRCFDQVEVELWFDGRKHLQSHEVSGGRWLEADEYQAELERFNAEPEEETESTDADDASQPGDTTDNQESEENK